MGIPAVRLTARAPDVVLSVRRRYHFISYELCFATAGSQTIKHTVKYTKIHLCLTLVAYMLLMGGGIRQLCAGCHVTAISYPVRL